MTAQPLYYRVFISLRDKILNGAYERTTPLPGENKLCTEYQVSRATVRHALDLLEEEGLVDRRQGARTYPKPLGYKISRRRNLELLGREKNHIEMLAGEIEQGYEVVKPDKKTWRQFDKRDKLGRVVRVRKTDGKPFCFVESFMPLEVADCIDWNALGSKPVITAASEAGFDFVKVEQAISATVANEEAAAAMDTPLGSPLLRVSGLFIAADGTAIMRKDGYFHPDNFEYRMTLQNSSGNKSGKPE